MPEPGKVTASAQPAPHPERLAFTLDASTGEIVKLENVDAGGQRRELSKAEKSDLAKECRGSGVEGLVERAFEAGIACLLDGEGRNENGKESEEEAGVRRILLKGLMENTDAAGALQREALRRAIVQTLIQEVVGAAEAETEPPKPQKTDRTPPKASN
jgi:hypothetical protein